MKFKVAAAFLSIFAAVPFASANPVTILDGKTAVGFCRDLAGIDPYIAVIYRSANGFLVSKKVHVSGGRVEEVAIEVRKNSTLLMPANKVAYEDGNNRFQLEVIKGSTSINGATLIAMDAKGMNPLRCQSL